MIHIWYDLTNMQLNKFTFKFVPCLRVGKEKKIKTQEQEANEKTKLQVIVQKTNLKVIVQCKVLQNQ